MSTAIAEKVESAAAAAKIGRAVPDKPVFVALERDRLAIRAGTFIHLADRVLRFTDETAIELVDLVPGNDYYLAAAGNIVVPVPARADVDDRSIVGGFHFAPGGNAAARAGGDDIASINPCSIWDVGFRPICTDPRGMALIESPRLAAPFWCDIYLMGVQHRVEGTSRIGIQIADGDDPPEGQSKLDYAAAKAAMAEHGKGLLSIEEYFIAAYGVTEATSADDDPESTGLDAARTSKFGIMQASGNLWVWGHDGDVEGPNRACVFGGYWGRGDWAGSRRARVGYWPVYSVGWVGARGRSDHLNLG